MFMKKIKRIYRLLLTVLLSVSMLFGILFSSGMGSVFAQNADRLGNFFNALFSSEKMGVTATADSFDYIYFDLAAGNVNIGSTGYSGYVYVKGNPTPVPVTGAHAAENHYYVYQSTAENRDTTGYDSETDYEANNKAGTNCTVPTYIRVQNGEKPWTDYVTNNTDVKTVSKEWEKAAPTSGRTSTGNHIIFADKSNYSADVTVDNIWSSFQVPGATREEGGITAHLKNSKNTKISIRLKGDSRLGNIHYGAYKGYGNQIIFSNGEAANQTPGSITVADFPSNFSKNHWCSAIGGDDNSCDRSDGIVINSGVIYAGTTPEDNCTAIGGGGNQYGGVTINGGTVTAVVSSTGTAIGGGIGFSSVGGDTDVIINDGTIYAYNLGIEEGKGDNFKNFVPAAAIGGGGSNRQAGSLTANITINGGTIYAQSKGGAAIGGGCSAEAGGGPATINITGGTVIAKSVGGTYGSDKVDAGVSIGGGTGATAGGSVTLNISGEDTILRTGSIGGGLATGKDAEGNPYKVGHANVNVSGGDIIGQVIMAGGAANPCSFTMTGGSIHDVDVTKENKITDIDDPREDVPIKYRRDNGGAVFMNDDNGKAIITGGLISNCTANNGGAIYMAGGKFILSGDGQLGTNHAKKSGGSVYVGGGTVQIGGGVTLKDGSVLIEEGSKKASACGIRNSDALENGGGVYVIGTANQDGATVTMNGGEIHSNTAGHDGGGIYIVQGKVDLFGGSIHDNKATGDGGGVYVAGDVHMIAGSVTSNRAQNGGGFRVENGTILMYGGNIDNNTAVDKGGGMHVSANGKEALIDIFSGSISYNRSKNGGGMSVVSASNNKISVTVGVNCEHEDLHEDTREFIEFDYPADSPDCGVAHTGHTHYHVGEESKTHSSCPAVISNVAEGKGGGFYLESAQTYLTFYCVIEQGNKAHGSSQCWNMDVKGGHVNIGDKSYHDETGSDKTTKGNILMQSSIFVEKGQVDVWGEMNNPRFTGDISVQIEDPTQDHYIDHREIKSDTSEHKAYKVHYYENFKDDTGKVSGLYIARQYPDPTHDHDSDNKKYDFTIMASIFSRPGYKIVGWNTKQDGTGESFVVNETYNLYDLAQRETNKVIGINGDDTLLVLYAIWEHSGYVLKFDPNVGAGETYTGVMENQSVTVGGSQRINANQFKRSGYKFLGWTLVPEPDTSDTVYVDQWAITTDFTREDGATITLYAKWAVCTHVDSLTYTANRNVLTQSCSACGHTATATVSAVNAVYDGNTHLATVVFNTNWLGENKPEITYEMAASEWDGKDKIDDDWKDNPQPQPLHAGSYTAKLTGGTVAAQVKYTISPVKWATPAVPQILFKVDAAQNSIIEISTSTDGNIEYKITELSGTTEIAVGEYSDWQKENTFSNIPFAHYYYFYAKVSADRDHSDSDSSKSEAYLADGGNIVYIENATGIKVEFSVDTDTDSFVYTVSADTGYHLRNNYQDNANTAVSQAKPVNDENGKPRTDATFVENGITLNKSGPVGGTYTYTVKFAQGVAYYQITLQFSGAAKNAGIAPKGTNGQVFGDFNDKTISISPDSAFTVQFAVSDYIPGEYSAQALSFTVVLPVGTTVIMKVGTEYWYYIFGTATNSIALTDFTAMGETGATARKFTFATTGDSATSFTYQFIVDFSQVTEEPEENAVDDSLTGIRLELTANYSSSEISETIALVIETKAKFTVSISDISSSEKNTATVQCTYKASAGEASALDGRKTTLVLTAPSAAPADLTLTAETVDGITLYVMSAKDKFIIPLGELVGIKDVKITLHSCLFGAIEDTLAFTADWYVSKSNADQSPLNGDKVATCNVTFTVVKDTVPSVRIEGTAHRCSVGGTLEVTVYYEGIPSGATITASLQSKDKDSNEYIDTGLNQGISNTAATISFSMGQMDKGSYRILVIVREDGANILQVPYYFVIV